MGIRPFAVLFFKEGKRWEMNEGEVGEMKDGDVGEIRASEGR